VLHGKKGGRPGRPRMECPTMTRLEFGTRSAAQAGFGPWFTTIAALTSPVQGMLGRPLYGDLPPLAARSGSRALATLMQWRERARQRRALREMSDHMLRDIGISRAQAAGEAAKPFWRD
jgi:uncharacterized protein YjiS (DUF1127 family)